MRIWNNLPASLRDKEVKTTENIHVSDGLRHIVTFLIITPYKYFYLLYLLTYLLTVVISATRRKGTQFLNLLEIQRSHTSNFTQAFMSRQPPVWVPKADVDLQFPHL